MIKNTWTKALCSAALAATPMLSHAIPGITDPAGDFLSTFAGSSTSTDLDVVNASALYNAATDTFTLTATMAGAIGATPNAAYVWGVNRGTGTAGFLANGIDGVRFDRVIVINANGTSNIGSTAAFVGNTVTLNFSSSQLGVAPAGSFANKLDYTWNLWPRDLAFSAAGFGAIADFAPNNANFTTTPVPEPETYALMMAGLGVIGFMIRRRSA
jgi:hypothetical protein